VDAWRRCGVLQVAQACLEDVRDCIGQPYSACLKRLVHLSPACKSDAYQAYRKDTKNADFYVSLGRATGSTANCEQQALPNHVHAAWAHSAWCSDDLDRALDTAIATLHGACARRWNGIRS